MREREREGRREVEGAKKWKRGRRGRSRRKGGRIY